MYALRITHGRCGKTSPAFSAHDEVLISAFFGEDFHVHFTAIRIPRPLTSVGRLNQQLFDKRASGERRADMQLRSNVEEERAPISRFDEVTARSIWLLCEG